MNIELIAKLSQKIDKLNNLEERCIKGILPDEECHKTAGQIQVDVSDMLPADSTVFHRNKKFRRETMWWSPSKNGYANEGDLKNVKKIKNHIENLIKELQPSFINPPSNELQFYFSSGQEFEAKKRVFDLMKRASCELAVIDPYLDETIFDYVGSLASSLKVKLLTGTHKPIFPKLLAPFKLTHPDVEARECVDCHDRFLVIDNSEMWQLGSSVNRMGETATMINKVEPLSEQYKNLSTDFSTWWKGGSVIL